MKVILVDDEQYSLRVLEKMLSGEEGVEIVASYTDPKKALEELDETDPQLAFLDIEMPGMNGLELGEQLINRKPELAIIFVTAYSEYALDAFEVSAIDYLLKPVNGKRLKSALQRLETRLLREQTNSQAGYGEVLRLKSFGGFEIYDPQGEVISWRTKKAKELFVYLWLKDGEFVNRDVIIEDVFPDKTADRGGALLHTTIYQIRNSLRMAGFKNPIDFINERYRLNLQTDSEAKHIKRMFEKGEIEEEYEEFLVKVCQSDFIEESYPWLIGMKQAYKERFFDLLDRHIGQNLGEKKTNSTQEEFAKIMLRIDPYSEKAARYMVEILGEQGKKRELDLFYREFENVMSEDMGEAPGKELEKAYKSYL